MFLSNLSFQVNLGLRLSLTGRDSPSGSPLIPCYMHASTRTLLAPKPLAGGGFFTLFPSTERRGCGSGKDIWNGEDLAKGHKAFYFREPHATVLKCGVSDKTCSERQSLVFLREGRQEEEGPTGDKEGESILSQKGVFADAETTDRSDCVAHHAS